MENASRTGRRSGNKGVGARWRGRFRIFSARIIVRRNKAPRRKIPERLFPMEERLRCGEFLKRFVSGGNQAGSSERLPLRETAGITCFRTCRLWRLSCGSGIEIAGREVSVRPKKPRGVADTHAATSESRNAEVFAFGSPARADGETRARRIFRASIVPGQGFARAGAENSGDIVAGDFGG